MPCDSGPSWEDQQRDQRRMDTLTRLACDHLLMLEAKGLPIPSFAQEFWAEHKEEDAQRELEELDKAEKRRLRKLALEKLTPEEKKALGIRGNK